MSPPPPSCSLDKVEMDKVEMSSERLKFGFSQVANLRLLIVIEEAKHLYRNLLMVNIYVNIYGICFNIEIHAFRNFDIYKYRSILFKLVNQPPKPIRERARCILAPM